MFGIVGIVIALFVFGTSALANLHTAGKYSAENAKPRTQTPKEIRRVGYLAFLMDALIIAVLFIF